MRDHRSSPTDHSQESYRKNAKELVRDFWISGIALLLALSGLVGVYRANTIDLPKVDVAGQNDRQERYELQQKERDEQSKALREQGHMETGAFLALFFAILVFWIDHTLKQRKFAIDTHNNVDAIKDSTSYLRNQIRSLDLLQPNPEADRIKVIGFKDLLIYLPFYLADSLGYLRDENIELDQEIFCLTDEQSVTALRNNRYDSIALCDPFECIPYNNLQVLYPLCHGIAAWPMTIRWIGQSSHHAPTELTIATYRAPSTSNVLAHFVSKELARAVYPTKIRVCEFDDKTGEDDFGAKRSTEEIKSRLRDLFTKYDVLLLWEPHCALAREIGARAFYQQTYESTLSLPYRKDVIYSAVVITNELATSNPSLPIRLRRALDRAVSRLQDPVRAPYCMRSLQNHGLLLDDNSLDRELVLARAFSTLTDPVHRDGDSSGWMSAATKWSDGLFQSIALRRELTEHNPDLSDMPGFRMTSPFTANDCRKMIYTTKRIGEV